MENKLATKDDIERLQSQIILSEAKMTVRMGAMLAAAVALLTVLDKLL